MLIRRKEFEARGDKFEADLRAEFERRGEEARKEIEDRYRYTKLSVRFGDCRCRSENIEKATAWLRLQIYDLLVNLKRRRINTNSEGVEQ